MLENYQKVASLKNEATTSKEQIAMPKDTMKVTYEPEHVQFKYEIKIGDKWWKVNEQMFMSEL